MKRKLFILIFLFIVPHHSFSQSIVDLLLEDKSGISIQKWTEDNVLPSNNIYSLLFSKQGFLWLGTDVGLTRFDGAEVKNFSLLNTPQIKANQVTALYEDKSGRIWFSNVTAGIVNYYNGRFKRFGIEDGFPENNCSGVVEDKDGKFWVSTRGGGLALIDHGRVTTITTNDGLPSDRISAIVTDKNNAIWIGTNNYGVTKIDRNSITVLNEKDGVPQKHVYKLYVDRKNRVWVSFDKGILVIENGKVATTRYSDKFNSTTVTSITEDGLGRVCITTANAAYVFKDNEFHKFFSLDGGKSVFIQDMLIVENEIWVATKGAGLFQLRINRVQNITGKDGLLDKSVTSIFQDSHKRIWIGNDKKVFLYNADAGKLLKILDLQGSYVLTYCELSPEKFLVGTQTAGIWEVNNLKAKKLAGKKELGSNLIRSIIKRNDGSTVIGTNGNGLVLINKNSLQMINKEKGLSSNLVSCLSFDSQKNLWVGTTGGGINILSAGNKITAITRTKGLAHNNVTAIIHDGNITWVATNGGGLSRICKEKTSNITMTAGLYDNRIFNMADDGNGKLWCSTKKGIYAVLKSQLNDYTAGKIAKVNYRLFTKTEGMINDECQTLTTKTLLVQKNKLWIATLGGISIIDFTKLNEKEIAPRLFIDDIKINSNLISIDSTRTYSPDTENLEIHYSGISFDNGKNLSFSYKLEGWDDKWISVGSRRIAYFTHLPPGKYVFKVKAETPQGTESLQPASFQFSIEPHFYEMIWFQVILAFLLLGIVAGIVRYISLKKLKLKLERIEAQAALEHERIRISKDMHDELGAELTKISLLTDIAKNNFLNNSSNVESDLNRISEASREVATTMDEIVWAVNPKNDKLDKMCSYIAGYIQEYLALTDIHLILQVPENIPAIYVSAEIRHNVFLVIKEAVNNVVLHSQATEVIFEASYNNGNLMFVLSDNGIGIGDQIDEFSNGTINMSKRITENGGVFEIVPNPAGGTIVKTSIRIN